MKQRNRTLSQYHFGNIDVVVKDELTNSIDISRVFNDVVRKIPDHFLNLIEIVYVGDFDFLKEKNVNAAYMDGAIYASNVQDSEEDFLDDVVHEIAHAIEKNHGDSIYADGAIEREFLLKRKALENILKEHGYHTENIDFLNTKYDKEFDNLTFEEIGYDSLRLMTVNIFLNPYSTISLREYFAAGFEEYYLGDSSLLREICPYIYNKLIFLFEQELENNEY
tara:strand:- start:702 stop:1367 length:666 start_codon:yes stop_codon:yes gene_type:complete